MTIKIVKQPQNQVKSLPLPDDVDVLKSGDGAPYGWRCVTETLSNGEVIYYEIPLTQADFLDPQEGSHFVQNSEHTQLITDLINMFTKRYASNPTTGVFYDMKMVWDIPGLKEPCPDLAIVPDLKDKNAYRSSFYVKKEETRPCLIVEVISPKYPGDDTEKVEIYQQAGVAEYIILNPHSEKKGAKYELWGYRLVGRRYQPIDADEQGRLLSRTTGVWFGLDKSRRKIILEDIATGRQLLTNEEEEIARLKAEARAEAEAATRAKLEARLKELEAKLQNKN